jgi:hypothetical protein
MKHTLVILCIAALLVSADTPPSAEPQVSFGKGNAAVDTVDASIWIAASPQVVWDHAVTEFDGWWPHCYKTDSHCTIEQTPGGRIYEQFADGVQGAIYGHVLYIEAPVVLKADGPWGMPGTAVSGGTWRLEPQDGGTLFRIKGEVMGNFDNGRGFDGREEAYAGILKQLKKFVETGERIDRSKGEQ